MKIFVCSLLTMFIAAHPAQASLDQCAMDLCGPAENYLPYHGRGKLEQFVSPAVKAAITKKVDPALFAMIDTEIANLRLRVTSLDSLILKSKTESLSPDLHAYFMIGFWLTRVATHKENLLGLKNGKFQVDIAKMARAFPELRVDESTKIAAVLNAYLATGEFSASQAIANKSYEMLHQQLTLNGTAPGNIAVFFGEKIQDQQNIVNRLGNFALNDESPDAFQKAIDGQLTESEKRSVKNLVSRLYSLMAVLDDDVVRLAKDVPFSLERAGQIANWSRQRDTLKGLLDSPSLLAKERSETLQYCRMQVNRAFSAAPTSEMLARTRTMSEQIKTASLETAKKYFTGTALEAASDAIRTARFVEPMGAEKIYSLVEGNFSRALRVITAVNRKTSEASRGGRGWDSFLATHLSKISGGEKSTTRNTILETTRGACDEIQPRLFEDSAYPESKLIQMGWQTALFPEVGIGIVSHELAHIVSKRVSEMRTNEIYDYTDVKTCSTSLHADLNRVLQIPGTDEGFQEEDWADAFAATTLKSLKKAGAPVKNFSCALVGLNPKQTGFAPQFLLDDTGLDTHSTGLLRALQLNRSLGGEVPRSCVKAVGVDLLRVVSRTCAK
jgi:hypothetical protein